jgi:hypothetical protein
MFELKLKDKTIYLKWGTWAMREFCTQNNITLEKYFEYLQDSKFDLKLLIQMVNIGYLSACISLKEEIVFNDVDVCDWIDELGSVFNPEGQLVDYIKYIIKIGRAHV